MRINTPDARLMTAVDFVRNGAYVADIGTDHAYLPVALVSRGICPRAVAADINSGPLKFAVAHIAAAGLSDKIETVLTDGLHGIEKYGVTDIIIFGMGGELIVKILDEAPWVKNGKIRLILQPMTHPEVLRSYLLGQGFSIIGEELSEADRVYQTICAEFVGAPREDYNELELLLGRENIKNGGELLSKLAERYSTKFAISAAGKDKSGADASYEKRMLGLLRDVSDK